MYNEIVANGSHGNLTSNLTVAGNSTGAAEPASPKTQETDIEIVIEDGDDDEEVDVPQSA